MINAKTQMCCIIGNPVSHSLSPQMHNAAYKALGLNFRFVAFRVTDVKSAIAGIRALGIRGVAVTIPHKLEVMKYVDQVDNVAGKIGAVNTVINKNGVLIGTNTDWSGAVDALCEITRLRGKKVALLGAGGAARAIAYGLKQSSASVSVFNRNTDKAKQLAKDFALDDYFSLDQYRKIRNFDIIINATSVGLHNQQPNEKTLESTIIPIEAMTPMQLVFDIVYSPRITPLVKMAKEVGCSIITGDRMLLHCVKRQFEIFTGHKAPTEILEKELKC